MADLNNLLIQNPPATGSAEKSGAASPAEIGTLNSDGSYSESNGLFAAIFKTSVEQTLAAKSGKSLPKSGDLEQLDTVSSGAELKSRQLKSGLQIIVGGAEPSTEGLDAFARTQGMDSRALAHLMGNSVPAEKSAPVELPKEAIENSEAMAAWLSDTTVTDIVARHAAKSAKPTPQVGSFQEMPAKFSVQGSASSLQLTGAPQAITADFNVSAQQIAEAIKQQAKLGSAPTLKAEIADKPIVPTQQPAQVKTVQLTGAPQATTADFSVSAQQIAEAIKQQAKLGSAPILKAEMADKPIVPTQQQIAEAIKQQAKLGSAHVPKTEMSDKPLAPIDRQKNSKAVMSENLGLPAKRHDQDAAVIVEKLTIKSVTAKTLTDNFNSIASSQQNQSSIKLETIDLTRSALNTGLEKKAQNSALLASGTAVPAAQLSVAPAPQVAAPTSIAFSEAAFTASQQNTFGSVDKALAHSLPEQLQQQGLQKQEQHTEMSRRLAEALGQRLTAQIARGAWRVEMDLHPKSLGRIEIQLEMKNGELEANFVAVNAATRELLNESMPKLRLALEEHGMETAYIGLGQGNQGNSDGKSTGQNNPESSAERRGVTDTEPGEIIRQLSNEGLDVLV